MSNWIGLILQWLGLLILLLGLVFVIRDIGTAIGSEEIAKMELLTQTWFSLSPETLSTLEPNLKDAGYTFVWDSIVSHILLWPTAYVLFCVGVFFVAVSVLFRYVDI